ncbi:MAG: pyruvate carboxyl transferase subunit, partial [Dehalococcoidia bacterium]|nr:pyruvate carboxyl transferase subunit [Dehalococcoidia bacterium]
MPQAAKARNPLKITETTLRDGHQCTFATRLRTEDMEPIAEAMDKAGFYSIEMWGGATFDVMTRFLAEDPWERVRILKRLMPRTPFQMLLRGQNLVGYRNYADDVVRAFVHHSAEVGIDIFRIFDALNDERNLIVSIKAVKEAGKHAQAAISYSNTGGKLGGDIFNIEYFVDRALVFQDMGADSICIKDMAGIITPYDVETLVRTIKPKLHVPLQLHCHYTSGMGSMVALKAAEAGVDILDACLAPYALRASQPAIEPLVVTLQGTDRDTGLDLDYLLKLGEHFERVAPRYRDFVDDTRFAVIDTGVLRHQIPGGMISNLVSQLREADALHRLPEVYEEIQRTRADMGFPPLVTPTSQIVGVQAVNNVLFGRYKMVTAQVKDYAYGLYGRPPRPMSPDLVRLALKDYGKGLTPITVRPGDVLAPEMEKAKVDTKEIAKDIGDVLTYALYPTTGLRFLRWKYGKEEIPEEVTGKTLGDIALEDEVIAKAKAGQMVEKNGSSGDVPARGPGTRSFNVFVGDAYYRVAVDPADGGGYGIRAVGARPVTVRPGPGRPAVPAVVASKPAVSAPVAAGDSAIRAPIPGIVIKYLVSVGDSVKEGDIVVVLEAMKMENALPTLVAGKVKSLPLAPGSKA